MLSILQDKNKLSNYNINCNIKPPSKLRHDSNNNKHCTPPQQHLPNPKRLNVSNSSELMRKDVHPSTFEEPDLLSNEDERERIVNKSNRSNIGQLSNLSSWKSEQPHHQQAITPVQHQRQQSSDTLRKNNSYSSSRRLMTS